MLKSYNFSHRAKAQKGDICSECGAEFREGETVIEYGHITTTGVHKYLKHWIGKTCEKNLKDQIYERRQYQADGRWTVKAVA